MADDATDPAIEGYARAIVEVARAEGVLERVEQELLAFGQSVRARSDLRERLQDERIDTATRLGVVAELLGQRAHPQTAAAASWVVQAGRARLLPEIADAVLALAAAIRNEAVAEVRSAVALDDGQRRRLGEAVERATGCRATLKVVLDANVVGGLVVSVGDTVIDGSVARKLAQLRTALTA